MWKDLLEKLKEYARSRVMQWFATPDEIDAVQEDVFPADPFPNRKPMMEDVRGPEREEEDEKREEEDENEQ